MTTELVLTIIGEDEPGLVEAVSRTVTEHHGNWEASRMARMAGRFAGILRVSVPAEHAEALTRALAGLEERGLRVVVEPAAGAEPAADLRPVRLELVGNDRPGVIRAVSNLLAGRGINIVDLATETGSAPMAGGSILKVQAELQVPPEVSLDEVRAALEDLVSDYMIDVAPRTGADDTGR